MSSVGESGVATCDRGTARVRERVGECDTEVERGVFCKWERDMKFSATARVLQVGGGYEIESDSACSASGRGI